MRLSANLIRSYENVNSFTYTSNWAINANESQMLYFSLVDLDQNPWTIPNETSWPGVVQAQSVIPNTLRYLTGQNGNTPVIVTVQFPSLNCQVEPLTIVATAVNAADASLFMVSLTPLQTPGSGNIIFTVQEGSFIRRFYLQNAITVVNVNSLGQC